MYPDGDGVMLARVNADIEIRGRRGRVEFSGPLFDQGPTYLSERITEELFKILAEGAQKQLIPRMRRITPFRSGQLKAAITMDAGKKRLRVGFTNRGYYWRFQRGGQLEREYDDMAVRIMRDLVRHGFQHAVNRALRG